MSGFQSQYEFFFSQAIDILQSGGEIKAVKQFVAAIEDSDYRDGTLSRIGVFLVSESRTRDGMEFVSTIEQPMERADALLAVAREHGKTNDPDTARSAIMQAVSTFEDIKPSTWEIPSILLEASAECAVITMM